MKKNNLHIRKLVLIALLGSGLNVFKFLIMFIPNVEVVTLLIVVYTYVFGIGIGMGATILFCVLEAFMWGFDPSWLIPYFIHWPTVALVAFFIKKSGQKKPIIIAIIMSIVTLAFGFQSTFFYMLTGGALKSSSFFARYITMYTTGTGFYIAQILSCFVSIIALFTPLTELVTKLGRKHLGYNKI
ncbi:MAG TPA: hypothetical protein VJ903_03455 [Clostridia bacterium]|nr:hypothetical protein [Clostridia bacterium]